VRTLRVSAKDLLFALDNRVPGTPHYVDTKTGEIVPVFGFNRDKLLAEMRNQPGRYFRIAPPSGRQGFLAMQEFVATITDPALRARLEAALKEPNIFRVFREALAENEAEGRRWHEFRLNALTESLRRRMREAGFELVADTGRL
jgi:uncharacterized NAD(P)/FAD-binding protein YdhS